MLDSENATEKITEALFATPATTGLVTKHSKYWRFHLTTLNLKRFMSKEYLASNPSVLGGLKGAEFRAQHGNLIQDEMREFLEQMISTGKERANIDEYVDKFTKEVDYLGGFEGDEFGWYFDYVSLKLFCCHFKNSLYLRSSLTLPLRC